MIQKALTHAQKVIRKQITIKSSVSLAQFQDHGYTEYSDSGYDYSESAPWND